MKCPKCGYSMYKDTYSHTYECFMCGKKKYYRTKSEKRSDSNGLMTCFKCGSIMDKDSYSHIATCPLCGRRVKYSEIEDSNTRLYNSDYSSMYHSGYGNNRTSEHHLFQRLFECVGDLLGNVFEWITDLLEDVFFDSENIIKFFHIVGSVLFLFLTILNINNKSGIPIILFFACSTLFCIYGTIQLFDYAEEIPLLFRTLIWIALIYFVIFDFGFGLAIVWRIIIGIVLFPLSYYIFDDLIL